MLRVATTQTLPPAPPSPPSGPPRGTWASRRNDMHPAPPSPARTFSCASSTKPDIDTRLRGALHRALLRLGFLHRRLLHGWLLLGLGRPFCFADLPDASEAVDIGDRCPIGGGLLPSQRAHTEAFPKYADEDARLRGAVSRQRLDTRQQFGPIFDLLPHGFGATVVVLHE